MIWLNGDLRAPEAAFDARDRGLLLGESVFETILVAARAPVDWAAHLARLRHGCALLGFDAPYSDADLRAALNALLAHYEGDRLAARLSVTGGSGGRGLVAADPSTSNWLLQLSPAPAPPTQYRLHLSDVVRLAGHPLAAVKTSAYLDAILARRAALAAGADEAVLLNQFGRVACCAAGNIFALRHKTLLTPAQGEGALPGIVRQHILAATTPYHIEEALLTPEQLADADLLLVTNSLIGMVPASLNGGLSAAQMQTAQSLLTALAYHH